MNQCKQPRLGQAAFALFEAMLVAALVLVLVTLGAPSFRGLQMATGLDSQSSVLRSTLRLGRDEAIRTQGDVVLCPSRGGLDCDSADWSDGWLLFLDVPPSAFAAVDSDSAGARVSAQDTVIRHTRLPSNDVQLRASTPLVRFDSRGRTQAAVFQICASTEPALAVGSDEQSLRLNLAGMVSYVTDEGLCES